MGVSSSDCAFYDTALFTFVHLGKPLIRINAAGI